MAIPPEKQLTGASFHPCIPISTDFPRGDVSTALAGRGYRTLLKAEAGGDAWEEVNVNIDNHRPAY